MPEPEGTTSTPVVDPAGTDLSPKVEPKKEPAVEPTPAAPETFEVDGEKLTAAEMASKYKGSVSKMHEATQETAGLRRENEALQGQIGGARQAIGGQGTGEPTDAQIEQQIADYEANYEPEKASQLRAQLERRQITRDVTASVTQKMQANTFSVNKTSYMEAVKQAHPEEFEGMKSRLESADPSFAIQLGQTLGIANPLEAVFEFHSIPVRRQKEAIAATEKAKRDASHVPASGVPTETKDEEDKVVELTSEEKAYARKTHPEMTAEEACKTYKEGKVLLAKEKEKAKLNV